MNLKELQVAAARRLSNMFPGYFSPNTKHDRLYDEYGYPEHPGFPEFYQTFKRNGVARGAIEKTIRKTWQDYPWLLQEGDVHDETTAEAQVRKAFKRLQFWSKLKDADRKGMVGAYSGIIFRFADNKAFEEPVTTVPGGLNGLVEIIPVYEAQLTVSDWDTDETSTTYGQPLMYQFNESAVGDADMTQTRSFNVHPDRVHIWSEDFTVHGTSALEAGLNALIDVEKVVGAGGEGFWKNAKNAPVLNMDTDAEPHKLADMLGVEVDKLPDEMNKTVSDWQKHFDNLLMLQGIEAKTLAVDLPDPEPFVRMPLVVFAASFGIPLKILIGSQTGERASTEDADEWAQTNNARREQLVKPNIERIIEKLVRFRILPVVSTEWVVDWTDLTEAGLDEKIDRAKKMAEVNKSMLGTGELVYLGEEIREVTGHEPLEGDEGQLLTEDLEPEGGTNDEQ